MNPIYSVLPEVWFTLPLSGEMKQVAVAHLVHSANRCSWANFLTERRLKWPTSGPLSVSHFHLNHISCGFLHGQISWWQRSSLSGSHISSAFDAVPILDFNLNAKFKLSFEGSFIRIDKIKIIGSRLPTWRLLAWLRFAKDRHKWLQKVNNVSVRSEGGLTTQKTLNTLPEIRKLYAEYAKLTQN